MVAAGTAASTVPPAKSKPLQPTRLPLQKDIPIRFRQELRRVRLAFAGPLISYRLSAGCHYQGRGPGVGRGLTVGADRGVGDGLGVAVGVLLGVLVAVAVAVAVAVGVPVAVGVEVAVAVAVGVGVGPPVGDTRTK